MLAAGGSDKISTGSEDLHLFSAGSKGSLMIPHRWGLLEGVEVDKEAEDEHTVIVEHLRLEAIYISIRKWGKFFQHFQTAHFQ